MGFFLKLVFFAGAFLLIILTVLANMGGKSDALKASIEQYAAEATGLNASVKTLNNLNFFPSIAFDFEGLELRRANENVPVVTVEKLRASLGFWDVMLSNGKMRSFETTGVKIMPGMFLDKTMEFDSIGIVQDSEHSNIMEGRGNIGGKPVTVAMGMAASGEGRGRKYKFAADRALKLSLGDLYAETRMINTVDAFLKIEDIKISINQSPVITGRLDILRRKEGEIKITGEVTMHDHKTILKPDFILNVPGMNVSGAVASDNFNARDFAAGSGFDRAVNEIISVVGNARRDGNILDDFFKANIIAMKTPEEAPIVFVNNRLKVR